MNEYPLRHVSIRVPWHDSGWAGAVCKAPHLNGEGAAAMELTGFDLPTITAAVAGIFGA